MQSAQIGNMMSQMMNTQVLSNMLSKPDTTYFQMAGILILLQLIEAWPQIKHFFLNIINFYWTKYKKHAEKQLHLLDPIKEKISTETNEVLEIKSSIVYHKKAAANITVDAINFFISSVNSAAQLDFNQNYVVSNTEEFIINKDVFCQVKCGDLDMNVDQSNTTNNNTNLFTIRLYSYTLELDKLKQFVEELKIQYTNEQNNKLGMHKYYFNQKIIPIPRTPDGHRYGDAPTHMLFTSYKFNTNKRMSNAFGRHLDTVKERVDMFVNHPEWYAEKGIPYTLGILLSGPPGTGKTSLIKAIAKDTNRHIINIDLNSETTQSQLTNVFLNDTIHVANNIQVESFTIPVSDRIYVIEDIDARSDLLKAREPIDNITSNNSPISHIMNVDIDTNSENSDIEPTINWSSVYGPKENNEVDSLKSNIKTNSSVNPPSRSDIYNNIKSKSDNSNGNITLYEEPPLTNRNTNNRNNNNTNNNNNNDNKQEKENPEKLTLGFVLNLLDGILETPGRILIMTSNHPEMLDPAFTRPGRVDVNLRVGYCTPEMFEEMYNFFYKTERDFSKLIFRKDVTPAMFSQLLQNNFNNSELAYEQMCDTYCLF
jgi:hypothetical protein